jgi:hypothetical protein
MPLNRSHHQSLFPHNHSCACPVAE